MGVQLEDQVSGCVFYIHNISLKVHCFGPENSRKGNWVIKLSRFLELIQSAEPRMQIVVYKSIKRTADTCDSNPCN